jgi:hypothetical protein
LYGLDVIESVDGPLVVDLNYFPGYKGVPNVAPLIAQYIEDYARERFTLKLPFPLPQLQLQASLNREYSPGILVDNNLVSANGSRGSVL